MMAAVFALFLVELWINGKTGGHSHGGATGEQFGAGQMQRVQGVQEAFNNPIRRVESYDSQLTMANRDDKKGWTANAYPLEKDNFPFQPESLEPKSEMPPWFIVFYEQYVRQRLEMVNMIKASNPRRTIIEPRRDAGGVAVPAAPAGPDQFIDWQGNVVDKAVYQKMNYNITLLEGGILFHSVFVGMTISITIDGFIILLVAILFHQMFEGLGLGSRIAAVPYPAKSIRPWVLVVAFGTTAPIGQAIGLLARNSYDPNSAFGLIIVGVFNAM